MSAFINLSGLTFLSKLLFFMSAAFAFYAYLAINGFLYLFFVCLNLFSLGCFLILKFIYFYKIKKSNIERD